MVLLTNDKKISCAQHINQCVYIILHPDCDELKAETAVSLLKTLLKNATPFLRGEETARIDVENAIKSIDALLDEQISFPLNMLTPYLCEYIGIDNAEAQTLVIPALCRFADTPNTDTTDTDILDTDAPDTEAHSILCSRISNLANIFYCTNSLINISKQLIFVNEVFGCNPPAFIGDDKCQDLTDCIAANYDLLDRTQIEEIVYKLFNKVKLPYIVNYCTSHPRKFQAILNELEEKYGSLEADIFIDDPFYLKKAERSNFVKGLQKYTLETLVLTKKFLTENDLTFYLGEGTLLGAIRHKGFIPWDDDIDIVMPRKDYNKLVELAKMGAIPPELNFDSLETNPKHWVLGAKMQLVRETPYIQHKVTELSNCNGPYVDIFPLDCWRKPFSLKQRRADLCVKMARRMLFMKTGYSTATKKKPIRILLKLFLPFVSNKWVEKFAIKNMTKFYRNNPKYYVNLCSYYPFYKEVFPASFFGEPKFVDFEGEMMPVPCEYDYILKTIYGRNYDTIPPVKVTNMRKHAFDLREESTEN